MLWVQNKRPLMAFLEIRIKHFRCSNRSDDDHHELVVGKGCAPEKLGFFKLLEAEEYIEAAWQIGDDLYTITVVHLATS